MTIGYLGPNGSFSQIAAKKLCPTALMREYASFIQVFSALRGGECDCIAVPIENSLNGGVSQNIDLLQTADDFIAVQECVVEVDHRLAVRTGADISKIVRVYSHQQALAQCAGYLAKNLPEAELIASPSTSAGLQLVKSESEAAIVGAHVKAEGFTLSDSNIADGEINLTHFLLVKRGKIDKSVHCKKVFFSATCRHSPGALIDLLKPMSDSGVNMTKIESRPIKNRTGEYRFFIEVEGDIASVDFARTLQKVEGAANSFRILGCY